MRLCHCLTVALLLGRVGVSNAHQPYESSAVGRLDGDQLELTVTTSAEIAALLAGAPMSDPAALEGLRPHLLEVGAELYEVTAGGQPLRPERVFFTLRGGEAAFSILYPLTRAGELRFQAAYLDRLPPGYGGSIEVFDDVGNPLGRAPLLKKGETKNAFSLSLPMAGPTPTGVASPATAEAQPPVLAAASGPAGSVSEREEHRPLRIAGVFAGLFLLLSLWRFGRLRK